MNSSGIKAIADALFQLIVELKKEDRRPAKLTIPDEEWRTFTAGPYLLHFRRQETNDAFTVFRDTFSRRKAWRVKWSDEHLDRAERALIGEAWGRPEEPVVLASTELAVERLEQSAPEYAVLLPLGHLYLGKTRITFPDIKLHTVTKTRLRRLRTGFYEMIKTTPHTPEEKLQLRADADKLTELLLNRPVVEVAHRGDKAKAHAEALRKLEPVLDFLQLIVMIHEPPDREIRIHLGGDVLAKQPTTFMIAADGSNIHHVDRHHFDPRFELSPVKLQRMKKDGFAPLVVAIGRNEDDRSNFEKSLLRSMHWIADADRQDALENKITSYITAIEMFFSSRGAPIRRDIAEGCAVMLGTSLEDRKELAEEMSELYGLRSAISHQGKKIEDERAERRLRVISINLLAKAARMSSRCTSINDFRDWLQERRLS